MVLAQYDEDTEEIIDGRKVIHKKGELKKIRWMRYHIMKNLEIEKIYGSDVLHYTDTFTKIRFKWNKYDFFDSQDGRKSTGGTIA